MKRKEEARGQRQLSNGPRGKSTMKNYSTKDRALTALAVISTALMIIMIGLNIWKDEQDRKAVWFDSYPMANQNIVWEGAGYQQIIVPEGGAYED